MTSQLTPASVRQRAAAAYVSINKLMARAKLPNSTFWRWESGHIKKPHDVTLQKIADALDAFEREIA